ncbi:MAG: VCBS repeat-containing protein [Candidatus Latescibacteria bacterium]|nr:VCBS repeat-containing protein [Candidatus Latescibacterota bacterium]
MVGRGERRCHRQYRSVQGESGGRDVHRCGQGDQWQCFDHRLGDGEPGSPGDPHPHARHSHPGLRRHPAVLGHGQGRLWQCDHRGTDLVGPVGRRDHQQLHGDVHPQRRLLLRNRQNGTFEDVSAAAGPGLEPQAVGRGAAFGDFDNDGDVDVFVNNNNSPATLLRNEGGNQNHWLMVKLVGGARKVTSYESRVKNLLTRDLRHGTRDFPIGTESGRR